MNAAGAKTCHSAELQIKIRGRAITRPQFIYAVGGAIVASYSRASRAVQQPISIRRFKDVQDASGAVPGIDAIFFQSSNTQNFADAAARAAFRQRWLGRYLEHDPEWAYVALTPENDVAGYLVASLDDPAVTSRFSDVPYFTVFKELTQRFPAHLHINLAPKFRGVGIGSQLIARFVADAKSAGTHGVHVVTSRGARNIEFYAKNGFSEKGATGKGAREVVFLAREL
jgi:ribosomal protein S18 acetylase RimI-like enzyme